MADSNADAGLPLAGAAGPACEVRRNDGRIVRGRLRGDRLSGPWVVLRDDTGGEHRLAPSDLRLAIAWGGSGPVAADHATIGSATVDPRRFVVQGEDRVALEGELSSVESVPDGLLLHGVIEGRDARVFLPRTALHALRIDLQTPSPSPAAVPAPAPAGTSGGDGRVVMLRTAADVGAWLKAYAGANFSQADGLPRIPLAQALADADPALARLAETAVRLGLPLVDLAALPPAAQAIGTIPAPLARRLGVLPLAADAHYLCVALSEPADMEVMNTLEFLASRRIVPVLASADSIAHALSASYDRVEDEALVRSLGLRANGDGDAESVAREAERLAGERPVVKLVGDMIAEAVRRRASDIHLRPGQHDLALLYRIDGELVPVRRFVRDLAPALVSRIKVIGGMNIAERRVPQDGRATATEGDRLVDLRISVLPTVDGESVVIRLLNTQDSLRRIEDIGFNARDTQLFRDLLGRSHGMLLVTGPTGCGKSTTLYAALLESRKQNVNIITVEDPVEYHIPSIEQVQVNRAAGTTFARTLRNILRHDPDVIMVGEIRDRETAEIAVESALTGHLVLSTLHTNSAATAVTRLLDLGVESFLLRSTLMAVLAQRLARRNCAHCSAPETVDAHQRELLGVAAGEVFSHGTGCAHCEGTGVRGRVAVYELLPVTTAIRRLVVPNADADAIHATAVAEGMVPITGHAVALARAGVISLTEAFRIRVE